MYDWEKFDHLFESHTNKEIADMVGCTSSAVSIRRREKGLPKFLPTSTKMTDYETAHEKFLYDKDSGKFFFKKGKKRGLEACSDRGDGYRRLFFGSTQHYAHRVAWLMHHGYWSENEIDHIDRNPSNNSIKNLREVSHSCNMKNKSRCSTNASGVAGVGWCAPIQKWRVRMFADGKHKSFGLYGELIDAAKARYNAEVYANNVCLVDSSAYKYILKHDPEYLS